MRQLASQIVRFLMVGGVSFLVDAGVLWLLVYRIDVGYGVYPRQFGIATLQAGSALAGQKLGGQRFRRLPKPIL